MDLFRTQTCIASLIVIFMYAHSLLYSIPLYSFLVYELAEWSGGFPFSFLSSLNIPVYRCLLG